MRLVFFGSGAFGLPTLKRLLAEHDLALVVTQPDRPAGRKRALTPTPVGDFALEQGLATIKPQQPNDPQVIEQIHAVNADAFVVIAYGHKLSKSLLDDFFAINLHASLLPKYRGAAPIHWAMIDNEAHTGVSVIELAQRMDAGAIFATASTLIEPQETAGELHDRLAELGSEPVLKTLAAYQRGELLPTYQDESAATAAPKLTKADGTVDFDQPAEAVRARVHGLTPWPGCTVRLNGAPVKLSRVQVVDNDAIDGQLGAPAGTLLDDGVIVCRGGAVRVLEIQPPGGKAMSWEQYIRGRSVSSGVRCEAL